MKFIECRDYLVHCYRSGLRATTFLSGPPGIGKSAAVKAAAQICAEAFSLSFVDLSERGSTALDEKEFGFQPLPLTVVDPLDFGGLPAVLDSGNGPYAARLRFTDLIPRAGRGFVLYDDLPTAPPLTQASAYRTIYERDYIGDGWMIVATGNRDQDRAATQRMPSPLVSKMGWIEFEPDIDGWTMEMAGKDGSSLVRAFIQTRPELFVTFDPNIPGPYATARTWESASDLCRIYEPNLPPFEALKGWVGEGPATEFVAYASMAAQLVHPDVVLMTPESAPIPEDPGALYAITTALASRATPNNFQQIITYLKRGQPEFAVYCIKSALQSQQGRMSKLSDEERRKTKKLEHTQAFVDAAATYKDMLT